MATERHGKIIFTAETRRKQRKENNRKDAKNAKKSI
jgi:hypothetical protein